MDDAGAVGVARERLERKRQEAYRSRAAATVKIQRWYRQCRESRGGVRSRDSEIDSASNQLEKCAKSPKASNSAVLDQESQAAPTDVNARSLNRPGVLSQSRSGRSTATVPQQQRNRFNEFVNSEVAIAMAMMDDSYESKLNDAQRKRVERLKAYRNNPEQPQPIKSPEVVPQRAPARAPNIISTKKRTQVVPNDSSKSPQAMSPQLPPVAAENSVRETSFPEKANSTLKRPLHVLQKGHAAKQDNDMISRRTAEDKGTAHTHRLVKEHGSTWQNGTNQLNNGNNKKLSKPTSYFKGQRAMKGQRDVRKQRQTKDEGQIEQQRLKDASHVMQLTPPIKDLVKIDNETTIESVNGHKLNKLTEVEVVTHAHIQPTDSTEHSRNVSREEEANIKLPETTRSVNTYKDHEEYSEREGKALHESQQKFVTEKTSSDTSMNEPTSAAPQLCSQSSCTPLREARTESETQATDAGVHRADKESIQETSLWKVQQNEVRFTSKDMSTNTIPRVASEDIQEQHPSELKQRRQEDTELEPLKRSSATTELTVAQEVREEMQSLRDASLPKRSQASQGIKTHSVMTQTRQLVSAFVQTEGESDSDSCYSSPKHPTRRHPCAQPPHSQAISQLHNGHTTQGGYALAYAKKRESNKKRAIKSLRSPHRRSLDKKQPGGYLQKFLKSSEAQNYLEDLQGSEWSSMPGLHNWNYIGEAPDHPYSPHVPSADWEVRLSSVTSLGASHDLPLRHQVVHKRPHHLRPLQVPTRHKHLAPKDGHRKSYTYHDHRHRLPHQTHLSRRRRSLSQLMPKSWRKELYYEPDALYSYR